jgi:hypothetical protein
MSVNLRGSNPDPLMTALGHKRKFSKLQLMSALPPKADIGERCFDVRFVPKETSRSGSRSK